MKLFHERHLSSFLDENTRKAIYHIQSEKDNYLLNVDEIQYSNYLLEEYSVGILEIDFDSISVEASEEMIPARFHPAEFDLDDDTSYKRQVLTFHIPFNGNPPLLNCIPSLGLSWTTNVDVIDNSIRFNIINFSDSVDKIKNDKDRIINSIKTQYQYLRSQLDEYLKSFNLEILSTIKRRKNEILKNNSLVASLGIPIRKREGTPKTYSVPIPTIRKSIYSKPAASESPFVPEPTISDDIYFEIIQTIFDFGKAMERTPSIYKDKEEEDLRDLFLMQLEPRYEGSKTGETFNKNGKTDILIRHEGNNLFIAECKIWHGEKKYSDSINQLLSYLTWRDSKSAIIIFVKNKDISTVLSNIEQSTKLHKCYIDFKGKRNESWFQYSMCLPDDRNRIIKLAVLLFHIP